MPFSHPNLSIIIVIYGANGGENWFWDKVIDFGNFSNPITRVRGVLSPRVLPRIASAVVLNKLR